MRKPKTNKARSSRIARKPYSVVNFSMNELSLIDDGTKGAVVPPKLKKKSKINALTASVPSLLIQDEVNVVGNDEIWTEQFPSTDAAIKLEDPSTPSIQPFQSQIVVTAPSVDSVYTPVQEIKD